MMTRFALLLLVLCTSSLVQGYDYFVLAPGSGGGICVSNETAYSEKDVFPIFDLDSNDLPQSGLVGWPKDWEHSQRLLELPAEYPTAYRSVLTSGSESFERLASIESNGWVPFHLLGSNVTLLLTHEENWNGKDGFKIEIQQTDKHARRSILKKCHELGTAQEHCKTLHTSDDDDTSLNSDIWVKMELRWTKNKDSGHAYQLKTNEKELFDFETAPDSSLKPNYIYVKSSQRPALFRVPIGPKVKGGVNKTNWFKRNFTIGEDHRLCVLVNGMGMMGVKGNYALSNALTGSVVKEGGLEFSRMQAWLNFEVPSSGQYKLELTDVKSTVFSINTCRGGLKIFDDKGKVTGCRVLPDKRMAPSFTIVDSGVASTAPADIDATDVAQICNALGATVKKETIKFCGKQGCFENKCG